MSGVAGTAPPRPQASLGRSRAPLTVLAAPLRTR